MPQCEGFNVIYICHGEWHCSMSYAAALTIIGSQHFMHIQYVSENVTD